MFECPAGRGEDEMSQPATDPVKPDPAYARGGYPAGRERRDVPIALAEDVLRAALEAPEKP